MRLPVCIPPERDNYPPNPVSVHFYVTRHLSMCSGKSDLDWFSNVSDGGYQRDDLLWKRW